MSVMCEADYLEIPYRVMHTLLEYRAGKLTCHERQRTSSASSRIDEDGGDVDHIPTDSDHPDRLQSVQLIRRAAMKLQHIHTATATANATATATPHGHICGHASVDTTNGDDEAAASAVMRRRMRMRMMMMRMWMTTDDKSDSTAVRNTDVVIGSPTSTSTSTLTVDFDTNRNRNQNQSGSNLGAHETSLQMNGGDGHIVTIAPSNGHDVAMRSAQFSMNGALKKSQSMSSTMSAATRIGLRSNANLGIHLSLWQGIGGDEDDNDNDDDDHDHDQFFLKETVAINDDANKKDNNVARIAAVARDAAGSRSDSFAGVRWLPERAICGATGTIRGMRHRVRAGIATFRQQQTTSKCKNFYQLEAGKVVVYTTSAGIVRATFQQCLRVKTILSTLLIAFDEKDVFKCRAYQWELAERLRGDVHVHIARATGDDSIQIPQVFIEGYHLGNGEAIEQLNECGRLRKILRPYQRTSANQVCHKCGGYLLLLCSACNGSKKSVTRNQFSGSLVPLRCIKCDECGLVPCDLCCCRPTGGQ